MNSETQILATGSCFIGSGVRSVGTVSQEMIRESKREILLAAYLLTSLDFIDELISAAERGVKITIVIDRLDTHSEEIRFRLSAASSRFSYFNVKEFNSSHDGTLHAKAMVCDRNKAIVGSANFSYSGMTTGNHELGIMVSGGVVAELAKLIESL